MSGKARVRPRSNFQRELTQIANWIRKDLKPFEPKNVDAKISCSMSKDDNEARKSSKGEKKGNLCGLHKSIEHHLSECNKFLKLSVKERKILVNNTKRCHNCLERGHKSIDCDREECPSCGKLIHESLHSFNHLKIICNIIRIKGPGLYLSSAVVIADVEMHEGFMKQITVDVSGGSSHTLISQKCFQYLQEGLKKAPPFQTSRQFHDLLVEYSDYLGTSRFKTEIKRLRLKLASGFMKVNAVVIPSLCTVHQKSISESEEKRWPHLKGLSVPDIPFSEADMILGTCDDQYLFLYETRKGKGTGPIAIHHKLGWTLTGPRPTIDRQTCQYFDDESQILD